MPTNHTIVHVINTLTSNGITPVEEGFYLDDTSKYITHNGVKITPKRNVVCMYYLVGGGAGGKKGSGANKNLNVRNGGGGGGVQIGRVKLISGTEYTVIVGKGGVGESNNIQQTDGIQSSITGNSIAIVVEGGNKTGQTATQTAPYGDNIILPIKYHTLTASINGNGGISDLIGANTGIAGKASSPNGSSSTTIGGGGGSGFGSAGNGGNGGNGLVILIVEQAEVNDNRIQEIEKQLREMNQLPGTMVDQYTQQYNTTMMAGALWTVLATSLVFYVFTQV